MTNASNTDEKSTLSAKFRLFVPILPGATLKERLIGCLGALIGIFVTGLVCAYVFGNHPELPLIVAPIGASAVLLFAVPASPLAQPWPIIGGNTISALVGVAVVRFVHDPMLAVGLAVALAIAVMSLTRSLHPPGGAAALTAVIGGPAVASAGFLFPLVPVAVNSVILVCLGVAFHRLSRRNYPHRALPAPVNTHKTNDLPPAMRAGFTDADIDAAIASFNETLDIERSDLDRLLRQVELQTLSRKHGELLCGDIMSRDVIHIGPDGTTEAAQALLLDHDIRTLPVVAEDGLLIGTVGLRELAQAADSRLPVSPAVTAHPNDPAISLIPKLTSGQTHAVIIVDQEKRLQGLISQTDLLATVASSLSTSPHPEELMQDARGI
ncbi:HPP family protein [Rhizobium sp. KVB221]|uniref:HPP family protein n=1 Tax=Rhizobium setariae TaxID=2801340 RepID=A0A936YWK6_9HYPH|nr:HPP family protein [Rhizobium setariae]MBL0374745.1 HPP family protein [Rhizobium setariae]